MKTLYVDLLPNADSTLDLGVTGTRWASAFIDNLTMGGYYLNDNTTTNTYNRIIGVHNLTTWGLFNYNTSATGSNDLILGNSSIYLGVGDNSRFYMWGNSAEYIIISSNNYNMMDIGFNPGDGLFIDMGDNRVNAFAITEGSSIGNPQTGRMYFDINTTNGSEEITFGNTTTNPKYTFLGTGLFSIDGNFTIGAGTAATDYVLTFDGETNDGVITWMEDEDYFSLSDGLLMSAAEEIYFRDTAIYIASLNDGYLDIRADTGTRIGDGTNYTTVEADGDIGFTGTAGIMLGHLMQSDNTDQSITDVTEDKIITFDTDIHHYLIDRTSSSRFTVNKAGSYLVTFSAIAISASSGKQCAIWMKLNGTNVDSSATYYTFKGANTNSVITVTFLYHFSANDYFELWWWGNDTGIKLDYTASVAHNHGTVPAIPACPSIIMTCNYVGKD